MEYLVYEQDYARQMETRVEPFLAARRQDGEMLSFDGAPIHYAVFSADAPRGRVVILHGFTESMEKFREITYYFLQEGYDVYIPEQRGHGTSHRQVEDLTLTHVGRFSDYVKDLALFMDRVVGDVCCLFAHSMGGAVAALYMEEHPGRISRAVLASPMIAPARGRLPLWSAELFCRAACLAGQGKRRLFLAGPYEGPERYEDSCTTSPARFAYYNALKAAIPAFQNSAPTYRWTLEAVKVTSAILKKGEPEKITAPVLLLQAKGDDVVLLPPQNAFIARLPRGELEQVEAKHEIYRSPDPVWHPVWERILAFLET